MTGWTGWGGHLLHLWQDVTAREADKRDIECIKISIDRKYDYKGNISLPGLDYEINGDAEEELKFWFDNARGIIVSIERDGKEKIVSGDPEMPAAKVDQALNTKMKFEIRE